MSIRNLYLSFGVCVPYNHWQRHHYQACQGSSELGCCQTFHWDMETGRKPPSPIAGEGCNYLELLFTKIYVNEGVETKV